MRIGEKQAQPPCARWGKAMRPCTRAGRGQGAARGGKSRAYTPRGHAARPCAGGKSRKEGREESGEERSAAAGPVIWQREVESPAAGAGILRRGPSIVHPAAGSSALPPHAALPLFFLCFIHLQRADLRLHDSDSPLRLFPSRIRGSWARGFFLCFTSRQLRVRGIFSLPFFALPSPPHMLTALFWLKPARGCMLHGTSQQGLRERGGSVVHVLQNRKRKEF